MGKAEKIQKELDFLGHQIHSGILLLLVGIRRRASTSFSKELYRANLYQIWYVASEE